MMIRTVFKQFLRFDPKNIPLCNSILRTSFLNNSETAFLFIRNNLFFKVRREFRISLHILIDDFSKVVDDINLLNIF